MDVELDTSLAELLDMLLEGAVLSLPQNKKEEGDLRDRTAVRAFLRGT